jgi:hypothetical protein
MKMHQQSCFKLLLYSLLSTFILLVPSLSAQTKSVFSLDAKAFIENQWLTGYQVMVTLKNNTANPTQSWQASFTLPEGQKIGSLWNGVYIANGNIITVNNPQWVGGGVIAAGASTTFGMVISKPTNGTVGILNLAAVANGVITPPQPPQSLQAPTLQAISNAAQSNQFQVRWNVVSNAQGYLLQQSQSSTFSQFSTVFNGNNTVANITVGASGTYYYRVFAFSNNVTSAASNIVSTVVTVQQPPSNSTYIIDSYWESWNYQDSINAIVNMKVDIINISFANFTSLGNHQYVIAGVESDTARVKQLVDAAHALGKKVKIAVGGATYPLQFQLQTDADAIGMAQAVAQYIANNNLDGVDYDIEDYPAPSLQVSLLRNTRQLLPNKLVTYTPKSPASTTYPYNEVIKNGHQYIDYLPIMAYDYAQGYRYQDDVQALLAMGVPASKIVVGLMPGFDDLGVMTSLADITTAAQYIKANGLKGIMFWDLNRDYANVTGLGASQATNTAWNVFNARLQKLFAL